MGKGKLWSWVEDKWGLDTSRSKGQQVWDVFKRSHQEALEGGVAWFTGIQLDLNDGYEYKQQVAEAVGSEKLSGLLSKAGTATDAALAGQGAGDLEVMAGDAGVDPEVIEAAQMVASYVREGRELVRQLAASGSLQLDTQHVEQLYREAAAQAQNSEAEQPLYSYIEAAVQAGGSPEWSEGAQDLIAMRGGS